MRTVLLTVLLTHRGSVMDGKTQVKQRAIGQLFCR